MAHHHLDARKLLCPMPVIKTQQCVKTLSHGDTLTVVASDPGAKHDLPCWCRINGHKLIACKEFDSEIHITLELIKDKE